MSSYHSERPDVPQQLGGFPNLNIEAEEDEEYEVGKREDALGYCTGSAEAREPGLGRSYVLGPFCACFILYVFIHG
ncbi:hypothetical protein BDV11DRAFT_194931 [Aspergillus similis]